MITSTLLKILGGVSLLAGLLFGVHLLIMSGDAPVRPDTVITADQAANNVNKFDKAADAIDLPSSDFRVDQTYYANDREWALMHIVATTSNGGDPAYVLVQKQDGGYVTVLGPGTNFDRDAINAAKVPQDLVDILVKEQMITETSIDQNQPPIEREFYGD